MRLDFLIGFMVEALAILILAKFARDAFLRRSSGENVNQMVVQKRSIGAATSQAGYLIGVLLGFLGAVAVAGPKATFWGTAGSVALAGVTAIILQLLADLIADALIFRGVRPPKGETEDDNLTLAVGKAAVSIATGMILRGALSDPEASFVMRLAWFGAGQLVMVIAVLFYCWLTPYDDLREIRRNNLAAGFPIAGLLLAVGLVMEAAVGGRPSSSAADAALAAGKFFLISVNLVYVFRLITGYILLPKVKRAQAIVGDQSLAAGLQEGISFLLPALIVTFFMT
ncbi:MAG TPA: DUF350 domain-containing protein [Polyangia bacterium]